MLKSLSSLFGGGSPAAEQISVAEAKQRQDAGAVLVDVREPDEWRAGRAAGARHVPLGQLPNRLAEIPRDRSVLLICRSGNRSGAAQRQLLAQGYTSVANVSGGMVAWTRAGLPLQQ